LAASARAVELPMPTGLPQPVISATRVEWGMASSLFHNQLVMAGLDPAIHVFLRESTVDARGKLGHDGKR
jgi:hypothetical protein